MLHPYAPIPCDVHDALELLCLRRAARRVRYGAGAEAREITGALADLRTVRGEEFLVVETAAGPCEIRLDLIVELAAA